MGGSPTSTCTSMAVHDEKPIASALVWDPQLLQRKNGVDGLDLGGHAVLEIPVAPAERQRRVVCVRHSHPMPTHLVTSSRPPNTPHGTNRTITEGRAHELRVILDISPPRNADVFEGLGKHHDGRNTKIPLALFQQTAIGASTSNGCWFGLLPLRVASRSKGFKEMRLKMPWN